ncbi:hypothetical protein BHE74_00051565 [Ensete ventricosum]|nr:hypothetical protein GW17_00026289 [Ensete ventricosum]RWW42845.1 hypothetical protein BHE74_00051565 [Ensete ventricosum]
MSLRLVHNEIVGQEEATTGRCNGCCGNRVRSKKQQGGAVVAKRLGRGGSGKGKQRRMATATGDKWQRWQMSPRRHRWLAEMGNSCCGNDKGCSEQRSSRGDGLD